MVFCSVANKNEAANKVIKKQKKKKSRKQKSASLPPWCMRMRAVREFNLSSLLLRAGDVHPNPGPTLRIAQFNILGFTPGKRLSLLHKAITHDLDVILLQELHIVENEASRLTLDGYQCFAIARDAKGGGVAVHIRKGIQCSLTSQSVSEVVEQATVCVKVGAHLCQFTSAYFPRGNKVTSAAVHSLSQADWTTHVICADANWDKHVAPNPGGSHIVDFCIDEGKPAGKVESYRPITLTSTIAKLMERIIHGRLRHLVTSENQAGFRAGMSATDVLMWLRAQVQPTSASKTLRTAAVFVDFSRAFDSVDHHLLLQRLQKLNVDSHVARSDPMDGHLVVGRISTPSWAQMHHSSAHTARGYVLRSQV